MAEKAIESLDQPTKEPTKVSHSAEGPPPASPRPRSAADSSLYSSVGKQAMEAGSAGMGEEGGQPAVIGMQGMALVQRGIQMLNLAFPENPGLPAVLADLTGRLQSIIPQLVAQSANEGMGLLSQMAPMMSPMGMQQPGMQPGMQPPGMPPGMAPGMAGGQMPPQMAGPAGMGPMSPPQGPMPPRPPLS